MDVDWLQVALGLFGGLAFFLAGLEQLSEGLKQASGPLLKTVLARLTTNRFTGALTGALVTGVLNSSSVTTVLVVGFVTAGVMTLTQSVAVIMGANIGSTVTAQILAFNITAYALAPVALGFFMKVAGKRERVRQYGMMLMGLGLVFFGMGLMSEGMAPLRSYPPFIEVLSRMERPLLGLLAGAVFTALVQSSAATMGLAIALASEGLLTLTGGLTLALGANIGTCGTALLAAIGKPATAVRAAVVHLMFNVFGALLWLPLLSVLGNLAIRVSPGAPELTGAARAAAEVPRQLANANTLFNVINTLLFIPFVAGFARLAERLVKERQGPDAVIRPQFLDEAALMVPALALQSARREIARLGDLGLGLLEDVATAMRGRDSTRLMAIRQRGVEARVLRTHVLRYLGSLRQSPLTERDSRELQDLMEAVIALDGVNEVVAADLVGIATDAGSLRPSAQTSDMLQGLHGAACKAVALAVQAVRAADAQAAIALVALEPEVEAQVEALLARQAARLRSDDPDYLRLAHLQMSIVDKLSRIYRLALRAARGLVPGTTAVDSPA